MTVTSAGLGVAWKFPLGTLFTRYPSHEERGRGGGRDEGRDGMVKVHTRAHGQRKDLKPSPPVASPSASALTPSLPGNGLRVRGFLLQKKVVQTGS